MGESSGDDKSGIREIGTETLAERERNYIELILSQSKSLKEAAGVLGINLSTLWRKRKQHGLEYESGGWYKSRGKEK